MSRNLKGWYCAKCGAKVVRYAPVPSHGDTRITVADYLKESGTSLADCPNQTKDYQHADGWLDVYPHGETPPK